MIRILIAEEHVTTLNGIKAKVKSQSSFSVVATATNEQQVLDFSQDKKAEVLLISNKLHGVAETVRTIRKKYPDIKVLLLTFDYTDNFIDLLLRSDAHGCELKDATKAN